MTKECNNEYRWLQTGDDPFAQQILELIASEVASMGMRVVRVSASGIEPVHLQIMVDTLSDEQILTVDALGGLSRRLSSHLEVAEVIDRRWYLEVSSPGVERYLSSSADFRMALKQSVRCEPRAPEQSELKGKLTAMSCSGDLDKHWLELQIEQGLGKHIKLMQLRSVAIVWPQARARKGSVADPDKNTKTRKPS